MKNYKKYIYKVIKIKFLKTFHKQNAEDCISGFPYLRNKLRNAVG